MKKLLLLLLLAGAAHAGTVIAPTPIYIGKPCLLRLDNSMVNLYAITVMRYYPDKNWSAGYAGSTVLFVGDRDVQQIKGNVLPLIEERLKECDKP